MTPRAGGAPSRYWHPRRVDPGAREASLRRVLSLARESLGMELGYFGTFEGGHETFDVVDRDPGGGPSVREGSRLPVDQTLCWQVVTGATGSLVQDARADRATRDLSPVTDSGVGAYVGVPVHRGEELLGMLCLVSSQPRPDLGAHDVEKMRLLARVVALELEQARELSADDESDVDAVRRAISGEGLQTVFQPVARLDLLLRDNVLEVSSVEALSRFTGDPQHRVEHWFDLAWRHGLGVELELAAIERALAVLPELPEPIRLAVNASPETIASSRLRSAIPPDLAHRVTVELTEHVLLEDYEALRPGLDRIRSLGVSLAIDDLGAGTSNLQHVVELAPEVIKVDLSITSGVEHDARRRALVSALVGFTRDVGIHLVTEGVERGATAAELVRLGVDYGQGFWLSPAVEEAALPRLVGA